MFVSALPIPFTVDKTHFRECLLETLGEMFGTESVSPFIKGDKLTVSVDNQTAVVDLNTMVSKCYLARY